MNAASLAGPIPLILRGVTIPWLPLLDTTSIHVEGIVSAMLEP